MIDKNQECDIVFDLLPLYMEQRTGKESNEFIRAHVEQCEECRKNMEFMGASYEQLFQETSLSGAFGKQKRGRRKRIRGFQKARGRIFVCGYLLVLLCFWLYMIFVLL